MTIDKLSHTTWKCKYHIVFAPKYRRQVVYRQIKKDIGKILRQLCDLKKVGLHGNLWVNQREIHQNPSSVKRQSGITAPVGRFYSVCRLTAART